MGPLPRSDSPFHKQHTHWEHASDINVPLFMYHLSIIGHVILEASIVVSTTSIRMDIVSLQRLGMTSDLTQQR